LLGALEALAQQDHDILVEREPDPPPRWVTLTVNGQLCTLDLERVDAPWSLRSTLQQALRFIQAHLAAAPPAESEQRLTNLELAATNGMLSALDRHSRLLDPETYHQARAYLGPKTGAGGGALRAHDPSNGSAAVTRPWAASFPRAAMGQTIGYLRLAGFPPGVSGEVEKSLLASEGAPPRGSSSTCATIRVAFSKRRSRLPTRSSRRGRSGPLRGGDSARTTSRTPTVTSRAAP
jgi:hypothetical protein